MDVIFYFFQWVNIAVILLTLIFLLISTKRYKGVIGEALMYLSVGIVINALVSVAFILEKSIDFNSFQRIGGLSYQDAVQAGFLTFAFAMLALGFYKLSKIYQRI
jgi:hypothetical protein